MPNLKALDPSNNSGNAPVEVANLIRTNSVYIATFMATMGCKPIKKVKGPEKTPNGDLITYWIYDNSDKVAQQVYAHWGKTTNQCPNWKGWSVKEKQMMIDVMDAFCTNLRWFLNDVKAKDFKSENK